MRICWVSYAVASSNPRSSAWISGKGFAFPITRDVGGHGDCDSRQFSDQRHQR
jgi:hypothetical protein